MKWNIHAHMKANPPGRPQGTFKHLDETTYHKIVAGFNDTLVLRRAALYARETPYHLKYWLEVGENDANNLKDTIYAQLFYDVGQKLSFKAAKYIKELEMCPKNWQSLTWIMERCLSQDYGSHSEEIQELIKNLAILKHKMESGDQGNGNSNILTSEETSKN